MNLIHNWEYIISGWLQVQFNKPNQRWLTFKLKRCSKGTEVSKLIKDQ